MGTYIIGDVHGCYPSLLFLLDTLNFTKGKDHLIFAGDTINRGAHSLEVLRFIHALGDNATMVLGNHEVKLLEGGFSNKPLNPFLAPILEASDGQKLLEWLLTKPLILPQDKGLIVHAGIPPQWKTAEALAKADAATSAMQKDPVHFFTKVFSKEASDPTKHHSVNYTLNALTRMRYVSQDGVLELDNFVWPRTQKDDKKAWFEWERASKATSVYFGHWSALGLYQDKNVTCLDTGCVWKRKLSAIELETQTITQIDYQA